MKYYTIHEFSNIIGKTPQTLRNWEKRKLLIPNHKSSNGYRYYTQEQLDEYLGVTREAKIIGYCRVSSNKQKDDLERQVINMQAYLVSQGRPFEIVTDIGSGINYNKKGLKYLIKMINANKVSKIVVLYKDRLLRFGFELVEYIAELNNCSIEVIDTTEKTEEQELVEDLVQIITVFGCKLQGKRANKAKNMIKELIESDSNS
ncbi:HTH-type transcriptional regulator CueR [compost metagenome]